MNNNLGVGIRTPLGNYAVGPTRSSTVHWHCSQGKSMPGRVPNMTLKTMSSHLSISFPLVWNIFSLCSHVSRSSRLFSGRSSHHQVRVPFQSVLSVYSNAQESLVTLMTDPVGQRWKAQALNSSSILSLFLPMRFWTLISLYIKWE